MKHLHELDKYRFLNEIYNYETSPKEFKYIGKYPSMVVFASPQNKFCVDLEPALEIIAKKRKDRYRVYYVDIAREPEMSKNFIKHRVPVIYICPIGAAPTIISETINVRDLFRLADKLLDK